MEKLQKNVEKNTGEIVIFKTSENNVSIDVRFGATFFDGDYRSIWEG